MKKKKFKVFAFETILIFIYCLLSIGMYIWFLMDATDDEFVRLAIVFTIMFVCLPLGLFIWSFYTKWPTIKLNEKNITKYLFHKKMSSLDWNQIEDIKKIRSSWALWVFISPTKMNTNSMRKLKKRKDIIYFLETEATKKIFLNNIPKETKHKYEQTFINNAEL